jgi:hypothetical protein
VPSNRTVIFSITNEDAASKATIILNKLITNASTNISIANVLDRVPLLREVHQYNDTSISYKLTKW